MSEIGEQCGRVERSPFLTFQVFSHHHQELTKLIKEKNYKIFLILTHLQSI